MKTYGTLYDQSPQDIVIGIDQSYSGFAVTLLTKSGEPYHHTTVYKGQGTGVSRLVDISWHLKTLISSSVDNGFEIVDSAMEGYSYGAQMAHMAGELGAVVKLGLWQHLEGTPQFPLIVPPANVKKYVTGKGTGVQKNQMLLHTYKTFGVEFDDDNAADSYALAMIASGRSKTAVQKEVLAKLADPKFREKP